MFRLTRVTFRRAHDSNIGPHFICLRRETWLADLGQERTSDVYTESFPFLTGAAIFNAPFPNNTPVVGDTRALPFLAFDPKLKLPYAFNWNVSVTKALPHSQNISATFVNSIGRRLLGTQTLLDENPSFPFLRVTSNSARSNYRALQVQFDRASWDDLSTLVSYTLAHSSDNAIQDSATHVVMRSLDASFDYGPSDFDVRHTIAGFVSYKVPAPFRRGKANAISRNWIVDSVFNLRSARPINVVYGFPTSLGFAYFRSDLLETVPLYLRDETSGGSRRINPAAFVVPSGLEQGNLGRNSLRGFAFYQFDVALRRRFNFNEQIALQVQADAFNLFNHPDFEDPLGHDLSIATKTDSGLRPNLTFGRSASLHGRSTLAGPTGSFGSLYAAGGPRSLRFSVKLLF